MGKKILRILFSIFVFVAFFVFIALVYPLVSRGETPVDYITKDFQEGNEISMLYICAITGHKTGKADDSLALLVKFNEYSELERQRAANLLDDANTWWEEESYAWDLDDMWEGACEQPLNNIRRTL